MRASTFRGDKQVTLQFEELRIVEEAPPERRKPKIQIVDLRLDPAAPLEKIKEQAPGLQVWAEGPDRTLGKNRFELHLADELAIYTAPPSPAELQTALETVRPKKVYLFGILPDQEKADAFLTRLSGLTKYVINQKEGRVTVAELAVVTGQREGTIRLGLEWLAAGGHISIHRDGSHDAMLLSPGTGDLNQYLQRELYMAVRGILEETAAFRAHFQRAEAEKLIELA